MEPKNSAARIYLLALKASKSQSKNTVGLWAEVFELSGANSQELTMKATQRLVWLNDELSDLIDYLKANRGYPEQGYAAVRAGVQNAISPQLFGHPIEHVRQHLKPEVIASLYQMALNLPDEEVSVDADELVELQQIINDLSKTQEELGAGSFAAVVLRRHIRLLQRALDAYPIWGVRAFFDSLQDAAGDLYILEQKKRNSDISTKEFSAFNSLKTAWKKVGTVAAEADKVKKVVALAGYAYGAIEWVRQNVPQ